LSDSRYVPRSFAVTPTEFGQKSSIEWVPDADLPNKELDWLRASQLQHGFAHQIRVAIGRNYQSVQEFADVNELDYRRLSRMLRGEAITRLEDVATIRRTLEVPVSCRFYSPTADVRLPKLEKDGSLKLFVLPKPV